MKIENRRKIREKKNKWLNEKRNYVNSIICYLKENYIWKQKKIQKSIQRANIFLNVEKKSNKFKHKTKKNIQKIYNKDTNEPIERMTIKKKFKWHNFFFKNKKKVNKLLKEKKSVFLSSFLTWLPCKLLIKSSCLRCENDNEVLRWSIA